MDNIGYFLENLVKFILIHKDIMLIILIFCIILASVFFRGLQKTFYEFSLTPTLGVSNFAHEIKLNSSLNLKSILSNSDQHYDELKQYVLSFSYKFEKLNKRNNNLKAIESKELIYGVIITIFFSLIIYLIPNNINPEELRLDFENNLPLIIPVFLVCTGTSTYLTYEVFLNESNNKYYGINLGKLCTRTKPLKNFGLIVLILILAVFLLNFAIIFNNIEFVKLIILICLPLLIYITYLYYEVKYQITKSKVKDIIINTNQLCYIIMDNKIYKYSKYYSCYYINEIIDTFKRKELIHYDEIKDVTDILDDIVLVWFIKCIKLSDFNNDDEVYNVEYMMTQIFENYFNKMSELLIELSLNNKSMYYEDFSVLIKKHILILIYITGFKSEYNLINADLGTLTTNIKIADRKTVKSSVKKINEELIDIINKVEEVIKKRNEFIHSLNKFD